jgi:hypothetical protein
LPPLLGALAVRLGTGLVGVLPSVPPARPEVLRISPEEPPTPRPLLVPNSAPLLVLPSDPTRPLSCPPLDETPPENE